MIVSICWIEGVKRRAPPLDYPYLCLMSLNNPIIQCFSVELVFDGGLDKAHLKVLFVEGLSINVSDNLYLTENGKLMAVATVISI